MHITSKAHHIDVIPDDHDIAFLVGGVQAAGRVRRDEMGDSAQLHDSHGHRALPQRVALVVVEAALHAHDGHAAQVAEHHLAGVARNRRSREVRDRVVRELDGIIQRVR